ncbi:MAG: UDP-N-acetylmuramoyl-tripeptide--D-alanyl-D-alanine ligase [Clostridium sp.]|jgi:UDP-N-acetylmuramoyl-tripeptide--D-alanyl-D-alanine ligase|nr:UDP-N-acetylmuramoyl-tripeptide--D-alanyl-D-alanine ligase [Clostridium sp.]
MRQMSLGNLKKVCGGELFLPDPGTDGGRIIADRLSVTEETQITCAVLDSRLIEPGGLFFAVKGERTDGHQFILSVFEKEASCVVTEKTPQEVEEEYGTPSSRWGAYLLVEDSLLALKQAAEFYRRALHIPVVGITGSVGKTSTKEFVAAVLSEKYKVLKTEGNYNNEIGLPLTLLRIRDYHEAAVVEMGISDFGEMSRLGRIARPDICVITNIGQCHLENLKSRDGILRAKTEIFEYLSPEGKVCLNGDDDKLSAITQVKGRIRPRFFGIGAGTEPRKEVYLSDVVSKGLLGSDGILHMRTRDAEGEDAVPVHVALSGEDLPGEQESAVFVHIPLPGEHMVRNAAAAACVGGCLALAPEQIAEGLAKVLPLGGRGSLIPLPCGTLIDDCYNANPISVKASIDLLATVDTFKTAILGDMLELGEHSGEMHRDVGKYAAQTGLDEIICIGENAKQIYEGAAAEETPNGKRSYYPTKQAFLRKLSETPGLVQRAKENTILVKASHGMGFAEIVDALRAD